MNYSNIDKVINIAAKDTKKGARVVAKVFYRILRKKGFSENQIIDIATNILNCLIESLKGYEHKIENAKKHKKEALKEYTFQQGKVVRTFTKYKSRYNDHENESVRYCAQL